MNKIFILIAIAICSVLSINADDNKSYKCEGNTYSSTGGVKSKVEPIATGFTYKNRQGNVYPIYMSNSGSCFIVKTSKKTNKEYRQYLGAEISQDICSKLGKTYKGKKNEK